MTSLARPDDWDDPVSLSEVETPQRVLVPFDGSHNSERALSWARLLALKAGAEVVVTVAFEQPLTMRGRGAEHIEAVRDELEAEALTLAQEAVGLLKANGVTARGVVVKGEPARGILEVCESEEADLIIIGRRGLTAELKGPAGVLDRFRDLMQGGVADKVMRHADVPVMVVS
jgi:nucleotide-binding universal stress UspA family protein